MTNGFLDNLSFMIECDITIFINDKSFDIPFDSDSHEILLNDSDLPDEIKQKLSKDDKLNKSVFDVIYKTIHKIDTSYSQTKNI